MSNSELLRIKNKQKTTYKNQKTASSYEKYRKRPNDRFGFNLFASVTKHVCKPKHQKLLNKKRTIFWIIGFENHFQNIVPFVFYREFFLFHTLLARSPRLELLEEVVTLIVNEDECREVFNRNLPDSLHAQLRILYTLDALDAAL